jgi:hypothetical protein
VTDRSLWGNRLEWQRLFTFEIRCCRRVDQVHVVSAADGAVLAPYLHDCWKRLRVIENGVDTARFHPGAAEAGREGEFLFVGSFGHSPNIDAAEFLLEEIWPRIRARLPEARLTIAGSHCPRTLLAADGQRGVSVRSDVADIAPLYRTHRALLVPIRAGSGTRIKILEALASGLPIVSTALGAEGLDLAPEEQVLLAEGPPAFANAACRILEEEPLARRLVGSGRRIAVERYDWRHSAERLLASWGEMLSSTGGAALPARATPMPPGRAEPLPSHLSPSSREPSTSEEEAGSARRDPTPAISVVIPTRCGGAQLAATLGQLFAQQIDLPFEVIGVDSGSPAAELAALARYPVRWMQIPAREFNHGLTRDLGAGAARGRVLVFLNQDATPQGSPLAPPTDQSRSSPRPLRRGAGGIVESGAGSASSGTPAARASTSRPNPTVGSPAMAASASRPSTAPCVEAWEQIPFGWSPILEDKKWRGTSRGARLRILARPDAAVVHSHLRPARTAQALCCRGLRLEGAGRALRRGAAAKRPDRPPDIQGVGPGLPERGDGEPCRVALPLGPAARVVLGQSARPTPARLKQFEDG